VGGAETEGTGAIVGGSVGGFVRGGAVGAAMDADAVGVGVRASVAAGNVIAGPGNTCGAEEPAAGDPEGEALALAGAALGES
jgi:hypothetical protein